MNIIEEKLREHEWFRERSKKNYGIAKLLQIKYQQLKTIDTRLLEDAIAEASTMDRQWRKTLEEFEDLRGHDYSEKESLVKAKQSELGYNVR